MSEQGGASRRAQRGGFNLFKRRRQSVRSRVTSQMDPRMNMANRGDVCQMGSSVDEAPSKRSRGWGWLFGGKAKTQREVRQPRQVNRQREVSQAREASRISQRSGIAGNSPRQQEHLSGAKTQLEPRSDYTRSSYSTHDRSAYDRYPRQVSSSFRDAGSRSSSYLPPARSLSRASETTSIVPLSRRGQVGRSARFDGRRSTSTHLQANQPTLIQASTSLQQNTSLQERDTRLEARRPTRSRKREEAPSRPRSRSLAIALYAARMLILSIGVGVLAGTVLSTWNPSTNPFFSDANRSIKQANSLGNKPVQPMVAATQLPLSQELLSVKTAVQGVAQQYPGFTPGVFLVDLDTNNFMDWSGSNAFPAASTIKVPVLIAFFQDVDAGKIRLDEKLTMRKDLVAPESGDMQFLPIGAQFTALETATKMITISDNTATNMLIDRLGGIQALNQRFKSWGLTATQITNLLPDLKGTNTTSPKELASLMVRVSQGELVSLRSRDRLLDIMRRTINNSQLPQGLGEGATIAHKTGDIGIVIGDVGLIDMPSGKRYATAVLIRRSPNDDRAYDLVAKVSRVMYQHFVSTATPKRSGTPASPKPETQANNPEVDAPNTPDNEPNTPELDPNRADN